MIPSSAEIREAVAACDEIAFAILFGSAARDALRKSSDIDLAVRFARPQNLWEQGGVAMGLEKCLGRKVELVELGRSLPPLLQHELSNGLWIKGDREEWISRRVRFMQTWRDFGPRVQRALSHFRQKNESP